MGETLNMVQDTAADAPLAVQYGAAADEDRHALDAFFKPRSAAVIGASEKAGSVGRAILWNLISHPFGGTVYAINPRRHNVLGIKSYPDISAVPETVDLAMIATPAATVPGVIDECIAAGVKAAIIISAGFGETGAVGGALEDQIQERIRGGKIRIIGPNSLGIMNPVVGLNAAFAKRIALNGTVGFISQSGAVGAAILDWSFSVNVGFSAFVSFGSMLDVGWPDLLYYLGSDPNTRSIVLYVQSIGDARSFLSALREVALTKPIIMLKAGRTEAAAEAAKATAYYSEEMYTDEVLTAAIRRSGVLRVDSIENLFMMAEVLGKQPRPKGPRLTIVSNAAGPGILATDALINGGGELAELSEAALDQLNGLLPEYWNHRNPVDILADADPDRYAKAVEIALHDPGCDGVLVGLTPQVMTEPTRTAEAIAALQDFANKPIIASWMGGDDVAEGVNILNENNIPAFLYPDTAARAFTLMWRYSVNLRALYETPAADPGEQVVDRTRAAQIIQQGRDAGNTMLSEFNSKQVLEAYGLPAVVTRVAFTAEEAVHAAETIGYPVALTFNDGPTTRKRGKHIHLNLADENAVRRAFDTLTPAMASEGVHSVAVRSMVQSGGYRVVIGSTDDPQFGPVLFFGSGGPLGEALRDRVLGLPPLNTTLARRMMERTRIWSILRGQHGFVPVDTAALEQLLVRFSQLVAEQRWIKEIDVNPFLAAPEGFLVLDARITLHGSEMQEEELPPLAIRPYPSEYVSTCMIKSGETVTMRPIRPEDEFMMIRFNESLSKDTVYFRYLQQLALDERIKHERLAEICFIDYDRAMALIAVRKNPASGEEQILCVCRMVKLPGGDADFAIVVRDDCQGQGLGPQMMQHLIHVSRAEKVKRLTGIILPENRPMIRMCMKLGFTLHKPLGDEITAEMLL